MSKIDIKTLLKLLPLLIFFVILAVGTFSVQNQKPQNDRNLKVSNFPDFSFVTLYDQTNKFSKNDLLGKTSLVNIFASWCTTCAAEHDVLMNLSSSGMVDLYGIAWNDTPENTIRYLERSGNPFLKVGSDNNGFFRKNLGIRSVPESFLLNKKGEIILHIVGNITEADVEYIRKLTQEER